MSKYINRNVENRLKKLIGHFPAILITGARQSGKSTLLEYINSTSKKKVNIVTLDNMKDRLLANEDPEMFLRTYEAPLIIDEFQYAPNLLSYIKIKVDEARSNEMFGDGKSVGTLYYLTGSQVFQTMEDVTESLAGRVAIVDLYPLSTREIYGESESEFVPDMKLLKKRKKLENVSTLKLFERIFRGSYPELYKDKNIDVEAFFSAYLRTYMERDVRKIINIKDEVKFMRFISSVAARTGQEYNANDIANDIGIDNETVEKWISVLVNTYIITFIQPHMNNNVGRAIKRPKLYFMDTGLACYLTGYIDANTLEKSAYSGPIFETYVVSEIIKSYANNLKDPRKYLYYYRDKDGKEIDLLIVNGDNIYPIEIKKGTNPGHDVIKNFSIVKKFEMGSPNGIVLCMSSVVHPIDDENYIVPIEYI